MTRREFFAGAGVAPLVLRANSRTRFPLAICSETFEGSSFDASCRLARETGYDGIEIAPFHLSDDPAAIPAGKRREFRRMMSDAGVRFAGTHALLSAPKGLHITTPDNAVRDRSWEYFRRLIDLTADLGENSVLVLGSSKQRAAAQGQSVEDATRRLEAGLAQMAPAAAARRATILIEPLAPHLCNVINTLDEAVAIVKRIGSPAVQTMLDTHNTAAEKLPLDELIRKHLGSIRHVHLNELDGRYPGSGSYDFLNVLKTLQRLKYDGWLSVEVFDFKPDGKTVAGNAARFVRLTEDRI
jgi:D-psicose/D-tagatose/L-ribulose 3-epimerase